MALDCHSSMCARGAGVGAAALSMGVVRWCRRKQIKSLEYEQKCFFQYSELKDWAQAQATRGVVKFYSAGVVTHDRGIGSRIL
jgi:hypothetical protein